MQGTKQNFNSIFLKIINGALDTRVSELFGTITGVISEVIMSEKC
jgi:hypothetical protein